MTDDRRMTTDRFYGGLSTRLENLKSMLAFVRDAHPSRDELNRWIRSNTQAGSADAVDHHLAFIASIDLIDLSETSCTLAPYGRQYFQNEDTETLYEALSDGVKGFNTIVEELGERPMTDKDIMELLVREYEEAEMKTPGPAIRHREWLQVLGYVERSDGMNRLTRKGEQLRSELISPIKTAVAEGPAPREIEAAIIAYERLSRGMRAPQLTQQTGTTSHWHAEQRMLDTYPEVFQSTGEVPSSEHLDNIVLWTNPVTVSHTRDASEDTIREQTGAAFTASDPTTRVELLEKIPGVGTAVATAILLFYNPKQFTVMNSRSVAGLADAWNAWDPDVGPEPDNYEAFLTVCREISETIGRSLRDFDRSLYVFGGSDEDRALAAEIAEDLPAEDDQKGGTKTSESLDALRRQAVEAGQEGREIETTTQTVESYDTSDAVREYVMARADGVCEGCDEPAPFVSTTGEPYLHAHHIHELSEGGSDTVENVIALCPNCHYRVHHGRDGKEFNRMLAERLGENNVS